MNVSDSTAVSEARRHVEETVVSATAFRDGLNAVYALSTADGTAEFDYVIKFGTASPDLVRVEPHVLRRLDEAGVPVPTVHGSGRCGGVPYFVASYLPGERPAHAADIELDRVVRLARELGGILGQIHRVSVGVGPLTVDGAGTLEASGEQWESFYRTFLETFAREAKANYGHLGSEATRLVHWVDIPDLEGATLAPIDLHTRNLLVEDRRITGVFDFERCYGGHPGWSYGLTEHFLTATRPDDGRERIAAAFERGYERHQPTAPTVGPAFRLGALLREMRAAHVLWSSPTDHEVRLDDRLGDIEAELRRDD